MPVRHRLGRRRYGAYALSLDWFTVSKSEEKITALQLVDAFVADYSDQSLQVHVGRCASSGDLPGTRDRALHKMRDASNHLRLAMVGPPGREIAIPPADSDMAQTIERFAQEVKPIPDTRFVSLDGETFFRTLYPSLSEPTELRRLPQQAAARGAMEAQ